MKKEIYIITYTTGSYSDRIDHVYAAYTNHAEAVTTQEGLQKYCEWYEKNRFDLNHRMLIWADKYSDMNPPPPTLPIMKKTMNPVWDAMSQKEWISYKKSIMEPLETEYFLYSDAKYKLQHEVREETWKEILLTLPEELKDYSHFTECEATNWSVDNLDFFESNNGI